MSTAGESGRASSAARRAFVRVAAAWVGLPAFFALTGGDRWWWQAWAYCALLLFPMTAFVAWIVRKDPEFIERRFKMQEKERAQRRVQVWGIPAWLCLFVVPGLDHRFGWSSPPVPAVAAGLALVLGAYLMILRVLLENRWAGRTVETWAEQQVVSTGPYAVVRHPMYSGILLLLFATPVALGSWWAMIAALASVPVFVFRIGNEESVLVKELPGYEEYRRKVRYRIVPGVW